jgi:uncharacterized protein DUF5818
VCQAICIPARQIEEFDQEGKIMKSRFTMGVALTLFTAALAMAADSSLTGWIADSKCGAKAAHDGARDCTIKCVKEGAKYVFVNDADKKVYVIDAQDKVADHAGHHVKVTGSLDGDTLKLSSIEMAQ